MVSTRRQRAQSHEEEEEKPASDNMNKPESEVEGEESEDDHQVEITNTTTTDSVEKKKATKKGKKLSAQELRKQQREQARAKELGFLPKTSAEDDTKNKPTKIVFDSDDNEELVESEEEEEAHDNDKGVEKEADIAEKASDENIDGDDDNDDDDAVEQMDSRVAKDLALEERQRERETKVVSDIQSKKKKKKRKKSDKHQEKQAGSDDDEDLLEDDDFFAELDAQRTSRRKKKRADQTEVQPKHTVFQTTLDKHLGHVPIEVNPGMELVVLEEDDYDKAINDEDDNHIQDSLIFSGEEPSETAVFHSRAQIVDGSDIISHKQMQKQRKHGLKPPDANWKRSKKMNRLLLSKGKGQAAANFAVKTYKF